MDRAMVARFICCIEVFGADRFREVCTTVLMGKKVSNPPPPNGKPPVAPPAPPPPPSRK